jgi:hypothetical protein
MYVMARRRCAVCTEVADMRSECSSIYTYINTIIYNVLTSLLFLLPLIPFSPLSDSNM